jgi:hypothetical protein
MVTDNITGERLYEYDRTQYVRVVFLFLVLIYLGN